MWVLTGVAWAETDSSMLLSDFNGQPQQLEKHTGQGKWLVVMIWASDCHVCNAEAESYAQFHQAHKDKDARILGISIDGARKKAEADKFLSRHQLPFPNLIAEPQSMMLYYSIITGSSFTGTPSFLIYDPIGNLVAAQAGAVPPERIEKFIASKTIAKKD